MTTEIQILPASELLERTRSLVAQERKITLALIEHLRECERRMLYAELGYSSLWDFATRHLGLSEGSAHRRISAMRLVRDLPEAKDKLNSGELSLSNAAKLHVSLRTAEQQARRVSRAQTTLSLQSSAPSLPSTPIPTPINMEQKRELLESICGKSQSECDREIVTRIPILATTIGTTEIVKPLDQHRCELKLVVERRLLEKLARLKGLLAHELKSDPSFVTLLEALADHELRRFDKIQGARETGDEPETQAKPVLRKNPTTVTRSSIPRSTQREVWRRAGQKCEYPGCGAHHALQIDHRLPVARGGQNTLENLRLLCRTHNLFEARRMLGEGHMSRYVRSLR